MNESVSRLRSLIGLLYGFTMNREITSTSNPLIKQLRALVSSKKDRQKRGIFVVEGWRGMASLLEHKSCQYTLELLVVSSDWKGDPRLPESVDTVVVPDFVFEKISDVRNAQGILGVVRQNPLDFEIFSASGNYLLLDSIRDPGNLGTLIRSAVGAGFDAVLLYGNCSELFNPKVIRSTMGTFAFSKVWNIGEDEIAQLLEAGYDLCVTTGLGGESLYEASFGKKNMLVVGSEAHGVSESLMQRATKKITIPLQPQCESLNAAIAGSICMFQIKHGVGG
jgi:TrmH family RNA methyltransferase